MFIDAYKKAVAVLVKKPFRLWGLSLLTGVISVFAALLTLPVLGIVGSGFTLVVSAGMAKVYLDALNGKESNSDQLFAGFKRFWTVLGGIAWKMLWIFIWVAGVFAVGFVFVSIFSIMGLAFGLRAAGVFTIIGFALASLVWAAGSILVVIKVYSYRFVEYILMTREDVSATQALRLSMEMTRGKKLHMFLADLIFGAAAGLVSGVLSGFAMIPFVGAIFGIVLVVYMVLLMLFSGIFKGLYSAAFFLMPSPANAAGTPNIGEHINNIVNQLNGQHQNPAAPQ